MQTSQKTSHNVCTKPLQIPKKNIDDITKRKEIVDLAELLQIDWDKLNIEELKSEVRQKIEEERKYSKPKTVHLSH